MIRAYFINRRGAGCVRPVASAAEAEKILRGGYAALEVHLEDDTTGDLIGQRWRGRDDSGRMRWLWSFDQSYFEGQNGNDNGTTG